MKRTETKAIQVGSLQIGNQNRVMIQSMCNTRTSDINATVKQILALEKIGCEIIRLAIIDEADALAIREIKKQVHIPLVGDIHYDYKMAILAVQHGIDKIRINPGNIGSSANVEAVVSICKEKHIPIRIGINSGSLEKDIHERDGIPTAKGMMESAQRHVKILTDLDFHDICLSFKSSDPTLCIEAYRLAAKTFPYPLHLGVTEAGTLMTSAVKSTYALGTLLQEGIGDTIRVSVNGDPKKEIPVVKAILQCAGLLSKVPNLIACPTCGRTQFDIGPIVDEIEQFLQGISSDVTVAIMGCAVNGPGEAKHADIAIAGGTHEGLLIKKGVIIEKISQAAMIPRLKEEILKFVEAENKDI